MIRLTDRMGRHSAPTVEVMGRSTLARRPLAVPVKVYDRVTGDVAPLLPVDVYAQKITALEQAEASRRGRPVGGVSWRTIACDPAPATAGRPCQSAPIAAPPPAGTWLSDPPPPEGWSPYRDQEGKP